MMGLVIDASVVLKWYLMDEECGRPALSILNRHVAGEVGLVAPNLLVYEVLNALLVAERRDRIAGEVTEKAFSGFLDLEISFEDPFLLSGDVLSLARSYDRSVYDASYLSLAKKHDIDFVTGDKRLFNAVKGRLKWVRWVGEWAG
jgi:predicted nucleic acid-binding protein